MFNPRRPQRFGGMLLHRPEAEVIKLFQGEGWRAAGDGGFTGCTTNTTAALQKPQG